MKLAVLLATFNRVDQTRECLKNLFAAASETSISRLDIVVVDADSPDGTASTIAREFPTVTVLTESRETYWAEGMRAAYEYARLSGPEAYLWLNDDVLLDADGIRRMIAVLEDKPLAVVAGSMRDPQSGVTTYSGRVLGPWWDRLSTRPVPLTEHAPYAHVDQANGNAVLVRAEVDEVIGGFPSGFKHALADFAYSMRAIRRGIEVLVVVPSVGRCAANPAPAWPEGALSRLKHASSPKRTPPATWLRYCFEFGGISAARYAIAPYLSAVSGIRSNRR